MTQNSYRIINLNANLKTSWPTAFDGGYLIQDINDVNVTLNDAILFLPPVNTVNKGQSVILNNITAFDFNVSTATAAPLTQIKAGEVFEFYLYDNTVQGGLWRIIPYGGGVNNINNVILESPDNSIVITNGNVTPPGGTVDLQLPESLVNLNNVNTTGIVTIKSTVPLEWTTRTILGSDNIVVTNGDGIADNPIISLYNNLSNIDTATIGTITINGNIIDSNNGNMSINTGAGSLTVTNNVNIGGSLNVNGATTFSGTTTFNGTMNINGNLNNPLVPKAGVLFTDTLTPPTNSIVILSQAGNIDSVTGSSGTYKINFIQPFNNNDINYLVDLTLNTDGGALPFVATAYCTVRDPNYTTIIVVDEAGQLVTSLPYGINVIIFSFQ